MKQRMFPHRRWHDQVLTRALLLPVILAGGCGFVRAQAPSVPQRDFEGALLAARGLCGATPALRTSEICAAVASSDALIRAEVDVAASEMVRFRIAQALRPYLASAADLKGALRRLEDALDAGNLKDLEGLALVPEAFCSQLGIDKGFCRLPACFPAARKGAPPAECPRTALSVDEATLRTRAAQWVNDHRDKFAPCTGQQQICIPVDRDVLAARTVLVSRGTALLAALTAGLRSSPVPPDAATLSGLVVSELACTASRALALEIATRIRSDSLDSVLAPYRAEGRTTADVLAADKRIRSQPCAGDAAAKLFSAVSNLLDAAKARALAPLPALPLPGVPAASAAAASTDSTGLVHDLPISSSGLVRALRLRLDRRVPAGGPPSPGRLSLLVQDPCPTCPPAGQSGSAGGGAGGCCGSLREIDLRIQAAEVSLVKVVRDGIEKEIPQLGAPLGINTYAADPARLAHLIQEIAGVPHLLAAVSRIAVGRELLPLSFDVKLNLPGLPSSLDVGTVTLSESGVSATLHALIDRKALLEKLNRALEGMGPINLRTAALGEFRLDSISVLVDDQPSRGFRYHARFRNSLLDGLAGPDGIPVVLAVHPDGTLTTEAAILPAAALARLRESVEEAVVAQLPQELRARLLQTDSWLRMDRPVWKDGAVSFEAVLAPPGIPALDPIAITVKPGADVLPQVTAQLARQANRLFALFSAYVESVLKRQGEKWLQNQARAGEAALRAALAQGISLFGVQLQVTHITTEGVRLMVEARGSGGGLPAFTVRGIRIGELDAEGRPVLSAEALEHAVIEGDFTSWLENSLGGGAYVKLRVTSAYFNASGLMLGGTVVIPALGDPFSVQIGPVTSAGAPINVGQVKQQLLARVLSAANARCQNCPLELGSLSVTVSGFRSRGDQLLLDGKFTLRDLVDGSVQVLLHPEFKIETVTLNSASQAIFGDLLHLPLGGLKEPQLESLNPLAVSVVVELSNVGFPFKFPGGFDLPSIKVRIPASGEIQISEPVSFPIPGDFPIVPPAVILSNARLDLYPRSLWKFGASGDLTVATGALTDVLKIAVRIEGDFQKLDFRFKGPLYLAKTLQLMETIGHIDVSKLLVEASTKSSGPVREILIADGEMTLDGKTCSFRNRTDIKLLSAVSVRGTLGVQLQGCQSLGNACAVRPGARGAVCAEGSVNLGPLGSAKGSADFELDLRLPVVEARVEHVPPFDVGVGVRTSEAFAKAWFNAFGLEFSVTTPSTATLTPDLIARMIEEALKFHLSLDALREGKISLSLLPAANGPYGGRPSRGPSGGPVANALGGQPGSGQVPGRPQPGMENYPSGDTATSSQQNPWSPGPYFVRFDLLDNQPGLFLRRYTKDGVVASTDTWPLHSSKVDVLKNGTFFAYPDFVVSAGIRAPDYAGFPRPREYQLFAVPPGAIQSCTSGVCSMRLGPEDDGAKTLRDLAGTQFLPFVFGAGGTAIEGFRKLVPFARPSQFGVLSDLTRAAWEPEHFGTLTGVSCLTSESPCTRFVVMANTPGGPVAIIHSDRRAPASGRFGTPVPVQARSLLRAALDHPDRSQWVLDVVDGVATVWTHQSDEGAFLITEYDAAPPLALRAPRLRVYTPGQGLGHPVTVESGLNFYLQEPGFDLDQAKDAQLRNLLLLMKTRQQGATRWPATVRWEGDRVVYRETGSRDAALAVISGDVERSCLRQASASAIVEKWRQWSAAGEAPPPPISFEAATELLGRILSDSGLSWRTGGFARNPLLLLVPQSSQGSVCSN